MHIKRVYDVLTLYLANEMGYDVLTPSIYQNNEKNGVITDVTTFIAMMGILEDYEDAMDFEVLKTEEMTDYGDYGRHRLKEECKVS